MMGRGIGGTVAAFGVLLVLAWAWQTAPLIVLGVVLIVGGWAAITIIEVNRRIREARTRWEHVHEEHRARSVDDEVDLQDEEGAFF